jgi:hypothetical protein
MLNLNYNVISLLQELNIDIERRSKDCNRNNFGNILIEFCRNNNMIICNGRVGKDKGVLGSNIEIEFIIFSKFGDTMQ